MKGEVFFKPQHQFPDGGIADKLLIALNDPSPTKNCLFVLTTTKQHRKSPASGCYSTYYVLSKGVDIFPDLTWILFDPNHVVEYDYKEYLRLGLSKKMELKGKVGDGTLKKIIDCFKRSVDVIQIQIDLLN